MGLYFSKYLMQYSESCQEQQISLDMSVSLARSLFETLIKEANEYRTFENPECLSKALLAHCNTILEMDLNNCYKHAISDLEESKFNDDLSCIQTDKQSAKFIEQTLLTLAARLNSVTVFSTLLSHADSDPNATDGCHNTPLHIAILLGRADIVDCLVKHPRTDILQKNPEGKTPLEAAVESEEAEIINLILEAYTAKEAALERTRVRP